MVLDKIETIKLKGKVISLRTATQKDGKEYVELENCIRAFSIQKPMKNTKS